MARALHRRTARSRYLRLLAWALGLTLLIDTLSTISTHTHSHAALSALPVPDVSNQKIFIASTHWNNEVIIRSHWAPQILDLVTYFGPQNLYISIYESGSWDNSKGALSELKESLERLGVPHTVTLDPTTHADSLASAPAPPASPGHPLPDGWIVPPPGPKARPTELRRIPYLSHLRNLSLKPLYTQLSQNSTTYRKILFLNDVAFTLRDIRTLLATRDGDYAAACALDFSKPPAYYDTFALRDIDGHEPASESWPFFRSRRSRHAVLRHEPVPVKSCWNGVAVFDAEPFYERGGGSKALAFRGIGDELAGRHLEGSECCLVHADNPFSETRGVWVNPRVRVGYSGKAYEGVHAAGWDGKVKGTEPLWPKSRDVVWGVWSNRIRRWTRSVRMKERRVAKRVRKWVEQGRKLGDERVEKGIYCLINEMQVLRENGWAHV